MPTPSSRKGRLIRLRASKRFCVTQFGRDHAKGISRVGLPVLILMYFAEYDYALSLSIVVASLTNLLTPLGLLQSCSAVLVAACSRLSAAL